MSEEKLIKVTPDELHALIQNKLQAAGLPEVQATETANHLVYADLCGVHSHGAVRVEYYSERIHKGGITLEPEIKFEKTGESSGVFHGDNAQGQYVANLALEPAIQMAKGIRCGGCRRVQMRAYGHLVLLFAQNCRSGISRHGDDPVRPDGSAFWRRRSVLRDQSDWFRCAKCDRYAADF